jgi:cardiolipin synthase
MHPRLDVRDILDVLRSIVIGALALVFLVLAMIGLLDVTRGTPVRAVLAVGEGAAPGIGDSIFVRTVQMYAGMNLEPGNEVRILENGAGTYPLFWEDLRAARRTITAQFYYSQPGAVADTFAAILVERARAGVQVRVLLDAFGSGPLRGEWSERLEEGGVRVAWLRPLRWYSLHQADHRSHVRAIIVDGEVGYTGGFGLADYWLGDGRAPDEWRETNVRVRGTAAGQLQAAFATTWAEATGGLLTGDAFFPGTTFDSVGTVNAGMLHTTPTIGSTPAERFLALTIAGAQRRLWIANSYFVPDDDFRRLLVDAARRGVDVRILVPGDRTDVKTTLWAGRRHYEELLRGGVRLWEYGPTNMHAKTFVADGRWSSIGSLNFDNRSLSFNDESSLVVDDAAIGRQMEAMFEADLRHSAEVTLADVERRPVHHRILAFGASLLARVL